MRAPMLRAVDDIRRSREAGFAAHLTKPASREAVVAAIAAIMPGQ
jgi:CheY-like chemotaxis protein